MSADPKPDRDEWRLGIEPGERHEGALRTLAAARDMAAYQGLEKPVMLVTVERLYWAIIAIYALVSRCAFLALRPLGPNEARLSLAAYRTMHLGVMPGPPAAWLELLDAAMLSALGASDLAARLLFALSGIALVLIALAFRRSIGRVGALAIATFVALSPSITYFSRSAATQAPALLTALVVIAIFIAIGRRASAGRFIAMGCAAGLALGADAQSLVVGASFALGLLLVGIARLMSRGAWLRARIWWRQHAGALLLSVLLALVIWAAGVSGFISHPLWRSLVESARSNWTVAELPASRFAPGLLSLAFYEFLIAIAAIAGALAVIANLSGARSALGLFVLTWTIAIAIFLAAVAPRAPAAMIEILVPAAMLGGIGIEALSRTRSWSVLFYAFAALALATFYIQVATNFVIVAPDPSEAPWARHALLFWSQPTTAAGAREALQQAIGAGVPPARSAWIAGDSPVLQWYLRDLTPAENPAAADLIAGMPDAPPGWPLGTRTSFDLESWWQPDFRDLSARRAIRFLLIARGWRQLGSREVTILTRAASYPTTIYIPSAPPSDATNAPAQPATAAIVGSPRPTP